jgi:hypothetical protein
MVSLAMDFPGWKYWTNFGVVPSASAFPGSFFSFIKDPVEERLRSKKRWVM